MFALVIYTRKTGREGVSDESAIIISFFASLAIALIYWLPNAISKYALLRLHRRWDAKLEADYKSTNR